MHSGTILVVDDDDLILKLVVKILSAAKFMVLSANSGQSALQIANTFEGGIDLLLSDVEMPEMTGLDLGATLQKARPDIHVMLMSGSTDGSLLALNYGWVFIQKPFDAAQLVKMVTEVLRTPDESQDAQA